MNSVIVSDNAQDKWIGDTQAYVANHIQILSLSHLLLGKLQDMQILLSTI